jgi:uncharacterized protein YndB with AHSA1/START domain
MTQTQQNMTVEVSKVINAPVEKVFEAWTEPDQLSKWLRGKLATGTRAEQDVRIGGQYRIENTTGCEGKPVVVTGTYKEIVPNKKLVFTWTHSSEDFPAKDTLVTVTFVAKGNSTEVIIKHTNFATQASAERHNMGWEACLENLAGLLALD